MTTTNRSLRAAEDNIAGFPTFAESGVSLRGQTRLRQEGNSSLLDESAYSAQLIGNISDIVQRFSQLARKPHISSTRSDNSEELSIFDRAAAILSLAETYK